MATGSPRSAGIAGKGLGRSGEELVGAGAFSIAATAAAPTASGSCSLLMEHVALPMVLFGYIFE
jgi:hypothetical protein